MADRLASGSRDTPREDETPVFDRVIDNPEDRVTGDFEIVVRGVDGTARLTLERVEIADRDTDGRETAERETDSREGAERETEDRAGVDRETLGARETDRLVCPLPPPLRSIRVRPAESNTGKATITAKAVMNEYFLFMALLLGKRLYAIALYHFPL
ncbi:MAG: hypothetical protein JW810_02055 [Sedimentisphaerales bacterium]|nr:hypothetical protein [Sedimentisphaerales bacterium]